MRVRSLEGAQVTDTGNQQIHVEQKFKRKVVE